MIQFFSWSNFNRWQIPLQCSRDCTTITSWCVLFLCLDPYCFPGRSPVLFQAQVKRCLFHELSPNSSWAEFTWFSSTFLQCLELNSNSIFKIIFSYRYSCICLLPRLKKFLWSRLCLIYHSVLCTWCSSWHEVSNERSIECGINSVLLQCGSCNLIWSVSTCYC